MDIKTIIYIILFFALAFGLIYLGRQEKKRAKQNKKTNHFNPGDLFDIDRFGREKFEEKQSAKEEQTSESNDNNSNKYDKKDWNEYFNDIEKQAEYQEFLEYKRNKDKNK